MSPTPAATLSLVRSRAQDRCEYCRMHQALQGATFHLEHVIPISKGGDSDLQNLAWCCPSCNLHKSNQTTALDPETKSSVQIFHPRNDQWFEHFKWDEYTLLGITPTGRATITLLKLNTPRRIAVRKAEERFLLFPPS